MVLISGRSNQTLCCQQPGTFETIFLMKSAASRHNNTMGGNWPRKLVARFGVLQRVYARFDLIWLVFVLTIKFAWRFLQSFWKILFY